MKIQIVIKVFICLVIVQNTIAQNVGINTNNPQEQLHLRSDSTKLALRMDNKKSSASFNYATFVCNPISVEAVQFDPLLQDWNDFTVGKLLNNDDIRLTGPSINISPDGGNMVKIRFSANNNIPANAELLEIAIIAEWRRSGINSGSIIFVPSLHRYADNLTLLGYPTKYLSNITDQIENIDYVQKYSNPTAAMFNNGDIYLLINPMSSTVNGLTRLEIDELKLEVSYRVPAPNSNVFWTAGVNEGQFRISNSQNLNSNIHLVTDENGLTTLKGLKISKNAGAGKVLTSNDEGRATWADLPQQDIDLLWFNKSDTAYYANGPVQVNNSIGQPALIFDKGENRLNNGINFAETDNRLFNVIIDANDDQTNEQFNIYKDNTEAQSQNPSVRFNLDGNDSWINGGGNLGVGTDTPQQKLSAIGTVRAANDPTETEFIEMRHGGNHALINTVGDGKLIIQHDGVHKMTIQDDGKVGVGYLDPAERLDVNGAIKIGNTSNTTTQAGTIRWNPITNNFEGFTGLKWLSLTTNEGWGSTVGNENQSFTPVPLGQNFGHLVDIHENIAVTNTLIGINDSLYIFNYDGNEWTMVLAIEDANRSLQIFQDYIITSQGSTVSIYHFSNGSWSLQQSIFNSNWTISSVDIHENTLVIGSESQNQVKIYIKNGANWNYEATLTPSNGQPGDNFGRSVSIFNDRVIVGAPIRNNSKGAVYIFNRVGVVWTEETMISASDGANNDFFGQDVDLKGNSFIVGAYSKNQNSIYGSGGAYVYKKNGGAWNETILPFSYYDDNSLCGYAVKLNGVANLAIVGCPEITNLNSTGNGPGRVHVFALDGNNWAEEIILTASDGALSDGFGYSASIHSEHIIIGAPGKNSSNDGKVYFFKNH